LLAYSLLPSLGEERIAMLGIVMYPALPEIWLFPGTFVWLAAWVVALAGVWAAWKRDK
jgi:hypothetical protein